MLFVTGDIHGEWPRLRQTIKYLEKTYNPVTLLVAGDFGIWDADNVAALNLISLTFKKDTKVFFVNGNHENYDILNTYPIIHKFGDKVQQINNKVFHIMRGSILDIDGYSVLGFGGATSTDKEYRVPFISWWPDEVWSYDDSQKLVDLLDTPNLYVDVVLTHEAPSSIVNILYNGRPRSIDTMTKGLELLKKNLQYGKWFFGHHHQDIVFADIVNDTKITGVYKEIHEVNWK